MANGFKYWRRWRQNLMPLLLEKAVMWLALFMAVVMALGYSKMLNIPEVAFVTPAGFFMMVLNCCLGLMGGTLLSLLKQSARFLEFNPDKYKHLLGQ